MYEIQNTLLESAGPYLCLFDGFTLNLWPDTNYYITVSQPVVTQVTMFSCQNTFSVRGAAK